MTVYDPAITSDPAERDLVVDGNEWKPRGKNEKIFDYGYTVSVFMSGLPRLYS